jgi:comEA protein
MFSLTPRERKVLIFIAAIILCGAVLRFLNIKTSNAAAKLNENIQPKEVFPININTANLGDLERIPGIGQIMATRIVQYRNAHGRFASLEDIKKVKGIGNKKFEMMKNYITLDTHEYKPKR